MSEVERLIHLIWRGKSFSRKDALILLDSLKTVIAHRDRLVTELDDKQNEILELRKSLLLREKDIDAREELINRTVVRSALDEESVELLTSDPDKFFKRLRGHRLGIS